MAIFHLSVKTFSRSKGQSATAAIAYRAGAKIYCEREGRQHDYTKKQGVSHSEIFLPNNAPNWASNREQLWNEVERAEKRKNSTVAREFEVALPCEMNKEERIELVQDFAKQIVKRHGCAVDINLHDDNRSQKPNHHAHIMLSTRRLGEEGFSEKTRELDERKSGEVVYWREQWAKTVNHHLYQNGINARIDHRSLKEQGLEREPMIKMGANAAALERKGIKTDKGNYNRAIKEYNPDKINESLKIQKRHAQEFYNKTRFVQRRLVEEKRVWATKQPSLYQTLEELDIPNIPQSTKEVEQNGELNSDNQLVEPQEDNLASQRLEKVKQPLKSENNAKNTTLDELRARKDKLLAWKQNFDDGISIFSRELQKEKIAEIESKKNELVALSKPLFQEINQLRELEPKKPLNPFKKEQWQKEHNRWELNLDEKIKKYQTIKDKFDSLEDVEESIKSQLPYERVHQAMEQFKVDEPQLFASYLAVLEELKDIREQENNLIDNSKDLHISQNVQSQDRGR